MAEQLVLINVRPVWLRALLALPVAAALWGAWHGVRWGAGATMAETARDLETAAAAERLAPRDPQTHLRLARLRRVSFLPEDLPKALEEYERAAALAPNDYLIWMEMGRARGAAGDHEGGVRALRRAVELAPSYAQPRWHLGNILLRAGRADEAFAELRRAADADPALRPQVFNLAWQVYDRNISRVVAAVSETPGARAQLAVVLVGRGQLENALAVWSSLTPEQRREHGGAGDAIARALYDRRQYRQALAVLGEAGATGGAEAEKVSNGGFESDIAPAGRRLFDWQVTPPPAGSRVAIDPRTARGGSRSLLVSFSSPAHVDFKHVAQVVAVAPSTRYRLSFFVRAQEVETAATLVVVAGDASADDSVLAASSTAPTGTTEWQEVSFEFTTGPRTEAVSLRLVRAGCAEGACPAYGKIWYDDFDLRRAAGRAADAAR
ncbi:MAG TPA: carbohydrate binding domain-containing protein [Pyrinomonadaceae bacterium]|nr:carbohydrate binding domain-containing protein [Pyrinomonadaceae bacterium]